MAHVLRPSHQVAAACCERACWCRCAVPALHLHFWCVRNDCKHSDTMPKWRCPPKPTHAVYDTSLTEMPGISVPLAPNLNMSAVYLQCAGQLTLLCSATTHTDANQQLSNGSFCSAPILHKLAARVGLPRLYRKSQDTKSHATLCQSISGRHAAMYLRAQTMTQRVLLPDTCEAVLQRSTCL